MRDIIVDDDYIKNVAKYVNDYGTNFEKCYSDYIKIMKQYSTDGATSGSLSNAVDEYIAVAELLESKVSEITTTFSANLSTFLADFDKADSYLY